MLTEHVFDRVTRVREMNQNSDDPDGEAGAVPWSAVTDVASLPEAALVDHLLELHRAKAWVEGALSAATSVFDAKKAWAADAARSGAGWLAARVDVSATTAKAEVALARELRAMPMVDAAAQVGRLGRAKVVLVAQVRTPELVDIFAEQEEYLVAKVEGLRVDDARRFLRRWQEAARRHVGWRDPDEPTPAAAPRVAVQLAPTFDGRFVLDGETDAEHGAIISSIITAEVDEMFRVGVFGLDDGLTPAERRGQALVQVLLRKGRAGLKNGQIRPSVEVIVDERTMRAEPIVDLADLATRVCEIVDAGPVDRRSVLRFLCEGSAHRLVISAEGEVLDVGFDVRLATRAQRRALRFRHQGCAFPGCSAPASWCDAHHVEPFDLDARTGPTDMANLVLLCRFHHHRVHDAGFSLTLAPDGSVEVRRPDGTSLTPCRGRAPQVEPDEMALLARERVRALRPAA